MTACVVYKRENNVHVRIAVGRQSLYFDHFSRCVGLYPSCEDSVRCRQCVYTALFHHKMVAKNRIETVLN